MRDRLRGEPKTPEPEQSTFAWEKYEILAKKHRQFMEFQSQVESNDPETAYIVEMLEDKSPSSATLLDPVKFQDLSELDPGTWIIIADYYIHYLEELKFNNNNF